MKGFNTIIDQCLKKQCSGTFILQNNTKISSEHIGTTSLLNAPYILGGYCYDKDGKNVGVDRKLDVIGFVLKEDTEIEIPNTIEQVANKLVNQPLDYLTWVTIGQLLYLRTQFVGDWEPNWDNCLTKYCISYYNRPIVCSSFSQNHWLSFPTEDMANRFLNLYKDKINDVKYFLGL